MVEGEDKKDEEKLEFDSVGQALGYISLDQARVLAMAHARRNRFCQLRLELQSCCRLSG